MWAQQRETALPHFSGHVSLSFSTMTIKASSAPLIPLSSPSSTLFPPGDFISCFTGKQAGSSLSKGHPEGLSWKTACLSPPPPVPVLSQLLCVLSSNHSTQNKDDTQKKLPSQIPLPLLNYSLFPPSLRIAAPKAVYCLASTSSPLLLSCPPSTYLLLLHSLNSSSEAHPWPGC